MTCSSLDLHWELTFLWELTVEDELGSGLHARKKHATVSPYSMNAAPPVPYFLCRICGSREYERVVVRRRDGRPYDTAFYACMGCTTMFGDPERFSKPPPPQKVTRVDAPISYR